MSILCCSLQHAHQALQKVSKVNARLRCAGMCAVNSAVNNKNNKDRLLFAQVPRMFVTLGDCYSRDRTFAVVCLRSVQLKQIKQGLKLMKALCQHVTHCHQRR